MIKNILANPLYSLLFGSSGILIVFISMLSLFKKLKKTPAKHNNHENIQSPLPCENDVLKNQETLNNIIPDKSTKEAISFVSDLTYTSPADDTISISKINLSNK